MGYRTEKGKAELRKLGPILKASWKRRRWWHPADLSHFYFDVFKESCEHAPYLMGHIYGWIVLVVAFLTVVYNLPQ